MRRTAGAERNSFADSRTDPLGLGTGANVAAGAEVAVVDPGTEQVWEALRALYVVGQSDDLAAIRPYERDLPDISNDVRRQAAETEKAIQARNQH